MTNSRVIVGDCREVLRGMEAESVHVCITSPPYWALRSYLPDDHADKALELGAEPTPDEYIATMVDVFREVRRVLRADGTCWVNMGDGYAHSGACGGESPDGPRKPRATDAAKQREMKYAVPLGLKPKDLLGMPWRLALALQADGWWLRSDIIWHKPNPMPESCTDRPTKAHEYLFLLTKAANYFYDAHAIREPEIVPGASQRVIDRDKCNAVGTVGLRNVSRSWGGTGASYKGGRNKRSVWGDKSTIWPIPTQAFSKAHFATFPEKLVEPCILAGTSDKGCCPECGAPWKRVVDKKRGPTRPARDNVRDETGMANRDEQRHVTEVRTLGWEPGCKCYADALAMIADVGLGFVDGDPGKPQTVPCTVLDPFCGSGTTGVVAKKLGRDFVGIELSEEYATMARKRIADPNPEPEEPDVDGQLLMGHA